MRILRENLKDALIIAIQQHVYEEEKTGCVLRSAKVAGWQSVVDAIDKGEYIEVSQ
jgi:hypothetical protein